jgi:hypothetical protein
LCIIRHGQILFINLTRVATHPAFGAGGIVRLVSVIGWPVIATLSLSSTGSFSVRYLSHAV